MNLRERELTCEVSLRSMHWRWCGGRESCTRSSEQRSSNVTAHSGGNAATRGLCTELTDDAVLAVPDLEKARIELLELS